MAKECPDFCCSINIGWLMHEPVVTVNGRSFERKTIEEHFAYLNRAGKPIMMPQKHLLESTQLVPNHTLKKIITVLVKKKA